MSLTLPNILLFHLMCFLAEAGPSNGTFYLITFFRSAKAERKTIGAWVSYPHILVYEVWVGFPTLLIQVEFNRI